MSGINKTELRNKIELALAKLKDEIIVLEDAAAPVSPENSIGRVSRMDAINNKSVVEAALASSKRKLGKLNHALTKLDSPDFGLCSRCKNPIQEARLMYLPESTRCVRCAE